MEGSAAGDVSGAGSGGGSGWGLGAGEEAEGDEDESMVYYFLEESTGYMEPALRCLSLLHTLVAFLCIIGYNCLKVGMAMVLGQGLIGWVGCVWMNVQAVCGSALQSDATAFLFSSWGCCCS